MAFPASVRNLNREFENSLSTALALKARVQGLRAASATGPTPRAWMLDLQRDLGIAISVWNNATSTPGMGQYAKDQFANQSLDIAAEFTTMVNAAVSLRDWINTNFPRDVSTGAVLSQTADINGVLADLLFTSAQLANFRTQADTFTSTIG